MKKLILLTLILLTFACQPTKLLIPINCQSKVPQGTTTIVISCDSTQFTDILIENNLKLIKISNSYQTNYIKITNDVKAIYRINITNHNIYITAYWRKFYNKSLHSFGYASNLYHKESGQWNSISYLNNHSINDAIFDYMTDILNKNNILCEYL